MKTSVTYTKNGKVISSQEVGNQIGEISKIIHFAGTNGDGNGMVMLTSMINLDKMTKEEITAMLVLERMEHGTNSLSQC